MFKINRLVLRFVLLLALLALLADSFRSNVWAETSNPTPKGDSYATWCQDFNFPPDHNVFNSSTFLFAREEGVAICGEEWLVKINEEPPVFPKQDPAGEFSGIVNFQWTGPSFVSIFNPSPCCVLSTLVEQVRAGESTRLELVHFGIRAGDANVYATEFIYNLVATPCCVEVTDLKGLVALNSTASYEIESASEYFAVEWWHPEENRWSMVPLENPAQYHVVLVREVQVLWEQHLPFVANTQGLNGVLVSR